MKQNNQEFNMVIQGTGGQGLITLLQIISEAAFIGGNDVKTSELHGLSQRGGSVEVHLRFGKKIYSPLVMAGKADLILSLEMQESLRGAFYANRKTIFLINKQVIPIPLVKNLSENEVMAELKRITKNINLIPASDICKEKLGNEVVSGIYLISLASFKGLIPIKPASILKAIKKLIPEKYLGLNVKAFDLARRNLG